MNRTIPRLVIALACVPSSVLAQNAAEAPRQLEGVDIVQKLHQQVPLDLPLVNEEGRAVELGDYLGEKPVVLALVYYECPMLCTLVLNGLLRAVRTLQFDVGREFDIVTVSFDPRDTPRVAASKRAKYLREYGRQVDGGWHFLTGEETFVRQLADSVGFKYVYDEETEQFAHASAIMVLTPQGKVSHYFMGVEYSPRDLRLALVEAADERIGSPVDRVLLLCYNYDPTTGKYGLVIMNVIRAGGAVTLIALLTFMLVMFRRDRRAVARANSPSASRPGSRTVETPGPNV